MIYFIEAVGLDRMKIGTTRRDVAKRVKGIETMCPCPIRLLRVMGGDHSEERALHTRFTAHRSHGEWFVLSAIADEVARLEEPLPSYWPYPRPLSRWERRLYGLPSV